MGPPPPAMVASEADGCISFSFGAGGGASADLEELPPEFERVDEEEAARVTIVVGTDHLGRDFGDRLRARFGDRAELVDAMSADSHHSCEAAHAAAVADADAFFG